MASDSERELLDDWPANAHNGWGVLLASMSCAFFAALADNRLSHFWHSEAEGMILSLALLAVLVTIACYVIAKIRPKPAKKERRASQWLSKFRESHSRGELSDEEFRTIKTTLASQLEDELNDQSGQED